MASRGLEGVVVAETRLSKIYGEQGRLIYNGYEIEDLAENTTFEEVCHLLWYGSLPNRRQLDELRNQMARERAVDPQLIQLLRFLPSNTHPMAALRTAASTPASFDPEAESMSRDANLRKALRITAKLPAPTAAFDRLRNGKGPLPPAEDLRDAANFLHVAPG